MKYSSIVCIIFSFLFLNGALAHLQYAEKQQIAGKHYNLQPGDDYSFENPFDLDIQLMSGVNPMEDGRFLSAYLSKDDVDVVKFTIAEGTTSTCNAAAWTPACKNAKNIYVHVALLGPLTDSRFSPITQKQRKDHHIEWSVPQGYGAILGINTPPAHNEPRTTLLITLPPGEIPNRWYLPQDSGEQCQASQWLRNTLNDQSVGKAGCFMPPQRCPNRVYNPVNFTCNSEAAKTVPDPFCPHGIVGNFCGPKPWRWINEVDLQPGVYYLVFWESKGKKTDVGYFLGWKENLRYGYWGNVTECAEVDIRNIPLQCQCGSKNTFDLPPNCIAAFPDARERTRIIYSEQTGNALWDIDCDSAPEYPPVGYPVNNF